MPSKEKVGKSLKNNMPGAVLNSIEKRPFVGDNSAYEFRELSLSEKKEGGQCQRDTFCFCSVLPFLL